MMSLVHWRATLAGAVPLRRIHTPTARSGTGTSNGTVVPVWAEELKDKSSSCADRLITVFLPDSYHNIPVCLVPDTRTVPVVSLTVHVLSSVGIRYRTCIYEYFVHCPVRT